MLSFEAHLLRTQAFAYRHHGLPRQRRCPSFSPEEQHLGQWLRTVIAKRRTGSSILSESQSWLVHELMTAHPQRWERVRPPGCEGPTTDDGRLLVILGFVAQHGRLPRLFADAPDWSEQIAGDALAGLRTRARGSRLRGEAPVPTQIIATLDYLCPEWRGPRALEPKRTLVKRPLAAA
ncbi:hypothetical protein [Pseudoclavibacter sp. VKM Ac-2888]|uniref:hypothetical protein n=1 Tax=Pseudoclavibacter sp. VKM Ac-2888 TaxID=2783830 RepID=UPI00188D5AD0|nr:hypothetical protein [Pseudoclavibacter sp. VKM Ac-2888]MBF4549321.1 hypothetical protein [Pseudoclavibacter sp. VKM Ac-2888]